jgi:hypothetical protein
MNIDLVGLREISTRTGVATNCTSIWVRQPDFPEPVACLSIGDVWVWGPVRAWLMHEGHRTDADLDPHPLTFTQGAHLPPIVPVVPQ